MNEDINSLVYFNYDVIWCKVFEIKPVDQDYATISPLDERNNELIDSFHKDPTDDEIVMRIIDIYIENALGIDYTPDNFEFEKLLDVEWRHIQLTEAESITDVFIAESDKTHTDYLEEHKTINNNPINWKSENEWVDYQLLKDQFFHKTFDAAKVQFYTNTSKDGFEQERYDYPCIVAIDHDKIGYLWFMT